jgi:hypothetical protein
MSISCNNRNPGTAFVRLSAFAHGLGMIRFAAARPVALRILFGLGFLCALAPLFSPRTTEAQAHIPATLGNLGNCLVGGLVVSPSVGSADNYIRGVAAIGPDDAWAVGHYENASGINQTLTMHWDGTQWQVVPSPNVGSYGNYLYAVSATSSGEVWAVGHYLGNMERTLTMRWNGSQWNIISSPNNGQLSNNLRGVSVVSPTDVWAVGFYFSNNVDRTLTLHWDGNQWDLIPSPNIGQGTNRLFSVSADSTGSAWAVGNNSPSASGSFFTLAMHWAGTQWTIFNTPNPGGDYNLLIGVFSLSLGDAWAVGFSTDGNNNPHHTLTAHWDGTQWSQVASPDSNLTENYLYSVSGTSAGDVWAAGYAFNRVGTAPSQAMGLHWDGTQWSMASSANSGTTTNTLFGVAALSPGRAIAGGVTQSGGNNPLRTFSLLYTSDCSSPTATTTPAASPPSTSTVPSTATAISSSTATSTQSPVPSHTFTATQVSTATNTATSTPTECPMTFTDVHTTDYFYQPVRYLYCHAVISGYADNTFRPYNNTTRGQLTKIVVLAEGWAMYTPPTPTFTDVPANHTFYPFIETAYHEGIISGYSCGTNCAEFRPGNDVTRGQLTKIVVLAEGWPTYTPPTPTFRDVPAGDTFYAYIETAYIHNIISGYSCGINCAEFRPGNSATRGQISKIVYLAVTQGLVQQK